MNVMARKLGHAAGTLTNVAQGLTENLAALPETVSTKVRGVSLSSAQPSDGHPKKRKRRTAASAATKAPARAGKRKLVARKTRGRKSVPRRKTK